MKLPPTGRRNFLKAVGLGAQAAPLASAQTEAAPKPAAPAAPTIDYPRKFTGKQLAEIAFPLGGVGAGAISLGGRGQLRDFEVFNRADKGRAPGFAFASIYVQAGKAKPVAHILESHHLVPYQTPSGIPSGKMAGLPHFADATFTGEYPLAHLEFQDSKVPVKVSLEAFTPIIPLDADESGLPVAILRYRVLNTSGQTAKVSIAYSMENPAQVEARSDTRLNEFHETAGLAGIVMSNPGAPKTDPQAGELALCARTAGAKLSYLRGWVQGKWWASPLLFWDDFTQDGEVGPEAGARNKVASICLQREIKPGASAGFEFLISWHYPNRTPAWSGWNTAMEKGGDANPIIGNHYATRFKSAWDAADYTASNLHTLEARMRKFLQAMRETTLPTAVKEAAMSNLSTLASTTCFRTADGRFRGFEGVNNLRGCCHGNCDHVWNYESTTHNLFPSLARSMRESHLEIAGRLNGLMPIRISLPEGIQSGGTAAADGQMGQIMKTYYDWQLSGDDAWLRKYWPAIKKSIEFCWVPGGWDADRDGVMEGVQHNTYDVEFFGPNPMCGIYYLGGLRAAEEMARAVSDTASANEYRRLFEAGSKWIDANLFNGEYYFQKIRGVAKDKIAKDLLSTMGSSDTEKPDFQVGDGCLVDQLVGQYVAEFAGLGNLVAEENIRKTLHSIYKYNYKRSLQDHTSVMRIFALNDESALVICDYGKGTRPRIPFPYYAEVMTGFEYSAAILMVNHGMVTEGLECIANIRRRYDGERRNPWDEAECGHHYARAMAAWSGILALSGFRYNGSKQELEISPKWTTAGALKSFWSTGTGWGTFELSRSRLKLNVIEGQLTCRSLKVHGATKSFPGGVEIVPAKPLTVSV